MLTRALVEGALLFFVLGSVGSSASRLDEDQQGSTSWLKEYLGDVNVATLAERHNTSLLHTSDGIAAMNMNDGNLRWRRHVQIDRLHVSDLLGRVITVYGSDIQLWSLRSGQLLWSLGGDSNDIVQATCSSRDGLVSVQSGNASFTEFQDGKRRWSTPIVTTRANPVLCAAFSGKVVLAVLLHEISHVQLLHLDLQSGLEEASFLVDMQMPVSLKAFVLNDTLLTLSADFQHLCSIQLLQNTSSCTELPVQSSGNPDIHASELGAVFTIPVQHEKRLFVLSLQPNPVFIPLPSSVMVVSSPFQIDVNSVVLGLSKVDDSQSLHMGIFDAHSGDAVQHSIIQRYPALYADGKISQPVKVWAYSSDDVNAIQFLFKAEDASLWYYSGEKWCWGRDEGLAYVAEMALLEIPHGEVKEASFFHASLKREQKNGINDHELVESMHAKIFSNHILKELFMKYSLAINAVQGKETILVAACYNGLVYALRASTGERIWVQRLQNGMSLVAMDTYACWNVSSAPVQVLVVLSNSSNTMAVVLNAGDGKREHVSQIPQKVTHVQALDQGKNDVCGYLMIGVDAAFSKSVPVHFFPRHVDLSAAHRPTIWLSDNETGRVMGYMIENRGDGENVGNKTIAHLSWMLSMGSRLLETVTVAHIPQSAHHVQVHGDRSISFRYLSPNMALLVSDSETDVTVSGLTMSIVETVSGQVLHSQFHPNASGPVACAFYENVAVVHFFDVHTSRWQMTVMELYDATRSAPSTWNIFWGAVTGHSIGTIVASAADPLILKVVRSSLFVRMAVQGAYPVLTRFGVAPNRILMATSMNQVYNLDAGLLDPDSLKISQTVKRKSDSGPTPPLLQTSPLLFATYDKMIASLRRVRTAPSQLESKIYMMAWGSDVYFATLRPSHGFDTLGDDFSHVLLLVALTIMAISVLTMSHMVHCTRLLSRWD